MKKCRENRMGIYGLPQEDTKDNSQFWETVKLSGSPHYKTSGTEPLDLIKDGGMLRDFCISSIIKYAYRNRRELKKGLDKEDMNKIKHYVDILLAGEGT